MHSGRFFSYSKKRKIGQNDHLLSLVIIRCHLLSLIAIRYYSLSFVVTHCYSLSLDIPLVLTRCTTRCHSLLLVVIRCDLLYHSLSLDISLVCLFINDPLSLVIFAQAVCNKTLSLSVLK